MADVIHPYEEYLHIMEYFHYNHFHDLLSVFLYFQVLRAQLELAQVKQEIDRRIAEKEEEFENTR